jgi:beta-phosphoglucomutase-like phosphatase (HAD superfamily)
VTRNHKRQKKRVVVSVEVIRAVQHCSRNATREETQAEEFNGKEEFTDEDDEDEDLDDEEDDDDGDDQFPPLKELEDLDKDRELRIAVATASELSGNGDI